MVRPVIAIWSKTWRFPWPYFLVDLAAVLLPPVRGVERARVRLRNCEAEHTRIAGAGSDSAILYLHGGAWLVGGLRSHRRLVSRLARDTGVPVLAVNYRKLPHASVSDAFDDCLDGFRRLRTAGIAADRIAVVGDSAGGYFALRVALEGLHGGLGAPGALVCLSPIIDLEPSSKLASASVNDPLFPASALHAMWQMTLASERDRDALEKLLTPASATEAELRGLPPTLIQVGGGEILRPDSEDIAARLAAAGVRVTLEVYPGQLHVFQVGADVIPEARSAVASITEHIRTALRASRRVAA
ncbi:alpha/beta hydrolase [Tsukamurella ocularis]|uniref:alpha/beta hydrolase n=1 Tax=Tsukamurella ocularis TaxID=1970234 RepID=UPI0021674C81|nr:alpha/beta hydrolase [Tsukamurella ocularis]MCS3778819.1 acetyl esterase/lipase [Tsukamurella ocularis]MCS3787561.1 acetyl esterase/lipase [Tsukamurella ocularis]MCS3851502.1 acetyl esterase/lipase [Tsukamurella ocularis]